MIRFSLGCFHKCLGKTTYKRRNKGRLTHMTKNVAKMHCSCTNSLYHYDFIGLERKWEPRRGILNIWPFEVQGKNTLSKSLQLCIKSCHLPTPLSISFSCCFFCINLIDCFSPDLFADSRYVVLVCSLWILFSLAIWKNLPLADSSTKAHVSEEQSRIWVLLSVLRNGDLSPEGLSSQIWTWQSP